MTEPHPARTGPVAAAPPAPDLLLLLIRHAEQRTMRIADAELSARGRRQAERLGARLASLPLTALVASQLRRARQTAEAIGRAAGDLEIEVEPGLEEVVLPDAERLRRYTEGSARQLEPDPAEYGAAALAGVRLLPGVSWSRVRGAESLEAIRSRGLEALDRVIARHPRGAVACVSHGGIINAILGAWTGADRDMWFVPWHTGVSAVLVSGEERIILTLNDASHLAREEDMLHLVAHSVAGPA